MSVCICAYGLAVCPVEVAGAEVWLDEQDDGLEDC